MYFASFFGFIIYGPRYDAETVLLGKKMISRCHAGRRTSRQGINELYFEHCYEYFTAADCPDSGTIDS